MRFHQFFISVFFVSRARCPRPVDIVRLPKPYPGGGHCSSVVDIRQWWTVCVSGGLRLANANSGLALGNSDFLVFPTQCEKSRICGICTKARR